MRLSPMNSLIGAPLRWRGSTDRCWKQTQWAHAGRTRVFSHAAPRGAAPRTLLGGSAWDSNANCSMAAARHPTPEAKRRNAKPRRN